MHIMKEYLEDCIHHTEWLMKEHPAKSSSAKEKDYISCCLDHCLKVMAVLAGKYALDKHVPGDMPHAPVVSNGHNSVNL